MLKRVLKLLPLMAVTVFGFSGCASWHHAPYAKEKPHHNVKAKVSKAVGFEHITVAKLEKMGIQVVRIGDDITVFIPTDKIFNVNSAHILPSGRQKLKMVVHYLKLFGNRPLRISGFTDNVGSYQSNHNLSIKQAQAISAVFWTHGIDYHNLDIIEGHGEYYPVANNVVPTGSYYNRRVEIQFTV